MRALALVLLAACAGRPPLVVDGLAVDGAAGEHVVAVRLEDDPPDVRVLALGAGWAVPLGGDRWLVPRHCFPREATHAFLRDVFTPARELAAGSARYLPELEAVANDWVVLEVAGSGGRAARRRVELAVGDVVTVPPSTTPSRVVDVHVADAAGRLLPGLIAVTRGDAERGWSGRPVVRAGVVVGIVHGADGDNLIALLLPDAAR